MNRNPVRTYVLAPLRIALGVGILFWLFSRMPHEDLRVVLAESIARWPWWLAAVILTFLGLLMGSVRWHGILRVQGLAVAYPRVFRIFFIGQFFNAFFLGACGGDLARAYYATLEHPGRKTAAATTVLVDRAIGLFTFIVFGCLMIVTRMRAFFAHGGTRLPGLLMALFLVASVTGMFALFRRHLFETWAFFRKMEEKTRFGPLVRRAYEAFYFYRAHPLLMASSTFLSLLNLAFLTGACYCFGRSLQIDRPLADYFALFPVITVLAALPITPGALGVREGLFAEMFATVGVASVRAVPLSLLTYLGGAIWSVFGGLLFVLYPPVKRHGLREEIRELRHEQELLAKEPEQSPGTSSGSQ